MIVKLKGLLEEVGESFVVLDVQGVCYKILCSGKSISQLPSLKDEVHIYTEMQQREGHPPTLYGFIQEEEKSWFNLLSTVQGVGGRVGMAILSALSPADLNNAILLGDKAMLSQADGVGPKLAARLATELKDKVGDLDLGGEISGVAGAGGDSNISSDDANLVAGGGGGTAAMRDAISALTNLGYQRVQAITVVKKAMANGDDLEAGELIRLSLIELSK